jgi:hypothetical protein
MKLADGTYKTYYYHRRTNTRLPDDPTSPRFALEYAKCEHPSRKLEGTVDSLIQQYQASAYFLRLKGSTRSEYRRYCDIIGGQCGDNFVDEMTPHLIYEVRNQFAATPRKADMVVAVMRVLFELAVELGLRHDNPAKGVKTLSRSTSYEPWPDDVIEAALERFRS